MPYFEDDNSENDDWEVDYTEEDIGLPEWGINHQSNPAVDNSNYAAGYRRINGRSLIGHALTIHIMGLQEAWNRDVFLEYEDRWWALDYDPTNESYPHKYGDDTDFTRNMWEVYRNDYPPVWGE